MARDNKGVNAKDTAEAWTEDKKKGYKRARTIVRGHEAAETAHPPARPGLRRPDDRSQDEYVAAREVVRGVQGKRGPIEVTPEEVEETLGLNGRGKR